jgi:O-antigen/teichoic acid export membrane protein
MSRTSKVLALSLAQFVMTIISVVSGMVFARYLSVADYATYLQTFLAYDIAVPILTVGLPSALFYFLPGNSKQKTIVLETMILLFIAGLIFSLFLTLGGTELLAKRFNNPDLNRTLQWMTFYPVYTFPVLLISSVLVIKDKTNVNAIYNVITGIILILSIVIAVIITRSYEFPLIVRIFLPILFFPVAIHFCFRYFPEKISYPEISSMIKIIKFSIPLGLATVFEGLSLQIGNIIVSALCSPEDFAIYANGAKEIPLIGIITGSITVVIMAEMSEKCKIGDRKAALELFRKAALISACFLFPIMCFFMFYAEDFIRIMYTDKYIGSLLPFRIYLLFLPVRIVNYGAAFIALGQSKKIMYRSILSLVISSVLCYLLVSILGIYGAAIAIIGTLYVWAIPYNWYMLSKAFNCRFNDILPLKRIGSIFILSVLTALASSPLLLVNTVPLVHLLGGAMCFGTVYLFVFNKYVPEFKVLVNSKLVLWRLKR